MDANCLLNPSKSESIFLETDLFVKKQEGCLFLPAVRVCVLQLLVTSSELQVAGNHGDRCRFSFSRKDLRSLKSPLPRY